MLLLLVYEVQLSPLHLNTIMVDVCNENATNAIENRPLCKLINLVALFAWQDTALQWCMHLTILKLKKPGLASSPSGSKRVYPRTK